MADYTLSSGNVFKDLRLPNPDERLAKAKLAYKINRLIADKGMTQKEAAKFLGISRSRMTDLRNGRLGKFSLDLLNWIEDAIQDYQFSKGYAHSQAREKIGDRGDRSVRRGGL